MESHENSSRVDPLYTESIRTGKSVRLFVSTIYLTLLSLSIIVAILDSQFIAMSTIIIVSITIDFVLLYVNFRVLRISITKNYLEVKYGKFQRKMVPFTRMTDCERIQISIKEYGGIGIRLGRNGTWAYNTSLGDAVKVMISDDRPFALSTANPEEVCKILREKMS